MPQPTDKSIETLRNRLATDIQNMAAPTLLHMATEQYGSKDKDVVELRKLLAKRKE